MSVALLDGATVLAESEQQGDNRSSGVAMFLLERLLRETGRSLGEAALFVADIGPGSFTGVRVGVTLAKAMAFANRVPAAGAPSFDLLSPLETAVVPSRKGEYFCRTPGAAARIVTQVPSGAVGYGKDLAVQRFPMASAAAQLELVPVAPEQLLPLYVAEPNISKPKDPRVLGGKRA